MKAPRTRRQAIRRVRRRLDRDGVLAQVAIVRREVASSAFQDRLNALAEARGDRPTTMEDVRRMAHRALDAGAVKHDAVALTFEWDPGHRKLTVHVRPDHRLVMKVAQSAKLVGVSGGAVAAPQS